jgi:hypothetical protein
MSYSNGSNTWPTGAVDIGATYGPRKVGGSRGEFRTGGVIKEAVFEIAAGTADLPYTYDLPSFYLIEDITLEVEVAFATSSTANFTFAGGSGLTTALALATKAITKPALTGLTNLSGTDSAASYPLVVTPNSNALASAVGKARLVIRYRQA